jgi:hypothetical protein
LENLGSFFVFSGLGVMTMKMETMDGTVGTDLALMGVPIFRSNPAPNEARIRYEKPVCRRNPLCRDCNYEADGFVCWHDANRCLRTDMMEIQNRRK